MTLCLYVVLFLRYSASKNGVTLKLQVEVVQGHWIYKLILFEINVKNFLGSLTTVVRAQNDTSNTANITYTIFDRTLVPYSPESRHCIVSDTPVWVTVHVRMISYFPRYPISNGLSELKLLWKSKLSVSAFVTGYRVNFTGVEISVGITNKLMGGPPWPAIASVQNFVRGPLREGPNFCKFCITPTTDFIGYSKENLTIQTGVPSPPFLPFPCLPFLSLPISPFP